MEKEYKLAETESKESLKQLQANLDQLGLAPVVGESADFVNAILYVLQGNRVDALISLLSMIPIVGDAAKATRLGKTALGTLELIKAFFGKIEAALSKIPNAKYLINKIHDLYAKFKDSKFVKEFTEKFAKKSGFEISEDTLKWLNMGDSNYTVYYGVKDGKAVYTGITKQELTKRLYQHNYNGKGFETLVEQVSGLTKNQARAIEQYLIENGPANALNKANSISPNSKYYKEALQWAEDYINKLK